MNSVYFKSRRGNVINKYIVNYSLYKNKIITVDIAIPVHNRFIMVSIIKVLMDIQSLKSRKILKEIFYF